MESNVQGRGKSRGIQEIEDKEKSENSGGRRKHCILVEPRDCRMYLLLPCAPRRGLNLRQSQHRGSRLIYSGSVYGRH
jgi:hypothetical protein